MSGGNSVQITTTENGWIFSKTVGGKTTSVQYTDENKNGKVDAKDTKVVLSMDAGDFSIEEFNAANKSIAEELSKKGETVGDWYNRKATEEHEEARAEAFDRQQRQQRMAQYNSNNKKSNFWNKATMVLGAICGFGGGFFSNGWQYDSGSFNDWNVRLFSTGVNGLSMTSNMLEAAYGNQLNATNYMSGGSTNMFGADFINQMMSAQSEYMQQQQEYINSLIESSNKAKAEADKKVIADNAKQMFEKYEEADDKEIESTNKAKLNEIYQPTKKPEQYTAEENAILQKIATYPQIPYEAVDDNNDKKLSAQVAAQINKLLADYRSYEVPESVQDKVISKADYDSLVSIVDKAKQGELSEEDIKKINEILKANSSKLSENE